MAAFRPKAGRAFTLIELLIVVAIIAILAAIAVPNFLEAQVRAKVSRLKADMRSICVAIESYRVDHTAYPADPWPYALNVITTPVSYITAIPKDDFARKASVNWGYPPLDSWYINKEDGYSPSETDGRSAVDGWDLWDPPRQNFAYGLISPGPDILWEWDRRDNYPDGRYVGDALYYDGTNGTVSQGDMIVYGPGNVYNPEPPILGRAASSP